MEQLKKINLESGSKHSRQQNATHLHSYHQSCNAALQEIKAKYLMRRLFDRPAANGALHPSISQRGSTQCQSVLCGSTNLVAFLRLVVPVGVWEMDVAPRLLHHPLDVVATFADNVRVLCV